MAGDVDRLEKLVAGAFVEGLWRIWQYQFKKE
jgi:hypothetical protein